LTLNVALTTVFRTNVLHCDSKQILTVRDNDQISLSNHYE